MGEMSFRYDIKNKYKSTYAFQYWFRKVAAYNFAYQRFVALYDTRIFDSPVVITKVATGLPFICGIFAHPRHSFDIDTLNGFSVWKEGVDINDIRHTKDFFLIKDGKSFIPSKNVLPEVYRQWSNDLTVEDALLAMPSVGPQLPCNIYPSINATPRDIVVNWLPNILGRLPYNRLSNLDMIMAIPDPTVLPLNCDWQEYHGTVSTNIGNIYENLFGSPSQHYAHVFASLGEGRIGDNILSYHWSISQGAREDKTAHMNEQILTRARRLYLQNNYNVGHAAVTIPHLSYFPYGGGMNRQGKFGFVGNDYHADRQIINLDVIEVQGAYRKGPYGFRDMYELHGRTVDKSGDYTRHLYFGGLTMQEASVHASASAYVQNRTGSRYSGDTRVTIQQRIGRIAKAALSFLRCKISGVTHEGITASVHGREAATHALGQAVYRNRYRLQRGEHGVFAGKTKSSIRLAAFMRVSKIDKDLSVYCLGTRANSMSRPIVRDESQSHAQYVRRAIALGAPGVNVEKPSQGVYMLQAESVYLNRRDMQIYASALSFLKHIVSVQNTGALEGAVKSMWHVRLHNFDSGYNGLIVPVAKNNVDVSTFNDEIGEMAHVIAKNFMVTENAMASVIRKPVFLSGLNYIKAEKLYHDVMMGVYNYFARKASIKAAVQDNVQLYRMPHHASWVAVASQAWKAVYADTPVSPACGPGVSFSQTIWAAKVEQDVVHYGQCIDAQKMSHNAQQYQAEFADKSRHGLYYFYDTFADKSKESMAAFSALQANRQGADAVLYTVLPASGVSSQTSLYEPVVYGVSSAKDAEVVQQLKSFELARKEVSEFLNDFGNWAWVYETPSPFESKLYGIDELLLPEEDPRYEYFEDIIFDKESMTPRDPIKILSPTSFLARYPIEMPIEEFADVGNIYEDSAEKWEQYFGIETDVMREIYLKYYQIWQAKIFEFSTMTMVQSTKKMLEYLYTWIDMYYPVEKMQQALRVFRQIRWFSESAIIKNSQYIISYEYDTLKSNLHTGECHIPNDLDAVTNPTMYIDQPNAVIRNDKTLLGSDAHVTFEIDCAKNTYMKFDLFTEYGKGSALIYLNDVLVRVCTSVSLGVIVQIPYTGDVNRVTIIKPGTSNIGDFYIGNISVPNASFKNLSIEFDPVLRAGNKPLEEVAQKMIAYANLCLNKNEMYAVLRRSNLGFAETYKQMSDYWKFHHQDKTKGKRLTIKQV